MRHHATNQPNVTRTCLQRYYVQYIHFIAPTSSQMHSTVSTVFTTATSDKDALFVSVPRQLLTSRFRLVPRPVAPPGVMTGFHSSSRSTSPPPMSRGSALHSLAKKISQKSRKLGKGHTSGDYMYCSFSVHFSSTVCFGCTVYMYMYVLLPCLPTEDVHVHVFNER